MGNPLPVEDAAIDGAGRPRALDDDTELRPSDRVAVAERVPERRAPLSEPPAAETEGALEENPDSVGQTLSGALGVELAVLRTSHADWRVGGRPLPRAFEEIMLAGGVELLLLLLPLREPLLLVVVVVVLVLALVLADRATLNPSSPSA